MLNHNNFLKTTVVGYSLINSLVSCIFVNILRRYITATQKTISLNQNQYNQFKFKSQFGLKSMNGNVMKY